MEASGAMNFKPRMTRIYTDKTEAQGGAWASQAALRFQIPSQASLHGILKTHRPLAPRAALLFRAEREMNGMGEKKTHGCDWLAKREVFWKSIRKLACECLFQNSSGIRVANQPS
jgi:hypothetical protein